MAMQTCTYGPVGESEQCPKDLKTDFMSYTGEVLHSFSVTRGSGPGHGTTPSTFLVCRSARWKARTLATVPAFTTLTRQKLSLLSL